MLKFLLKRLLLAIPVLWAAASIAFILVRLAPGGPFTDERAYPPHTLAQLNRHYGLDAPLHIQYLRYFANLMRGNLGLSPTQGGRSVNEIIAEAFPASLELGAWSLLVAILIGLPAGLASALRPGSLLDHGTMASALVGICVPPFVLGPLLVLLFSLQLGWVHAAGWNTAGDRILPALTLGIVYAAYIARLARAGLLEVLPMDYIRTAHAKGLHPLRVIAIHALKPGILPVVSFLGPAIAGLISGSFVIETLFHIPGLGRVFVSAAFNRDYTLVLGLVVFYAALVIICNTIVDLLLAALNPRIKLNP
jgi:oligopeptide transport system permease protein